MLGTESVLKKKGSESKKKNLQSRAILENMKLLNEKWKNCVEIPNAEKIEILILHITPEEGIWKGYTHDVEVKFREFPMRHPVLRFLTKIYHPLVHTSVSMTDGIVTCMLRHQGGPVYNLNNIFNNFEKILIDPDPEKIGDCCNLVAHKQYHEDYEGFVKKAKEIMEKYAKRKD